MGSLRPFADSALRHARRYLSALRIQRALRRVASDDDAVAGAQAFRFDGLKFLVRAPEEVSRLLERVADLRPRRVLEIGTAHGGTLYLWSRIAAPDALLIAVDSTPLGRLGRWSPLALLFRSFASVAQRLELVFGAASQSAATVCRVGTLLDGEQVDFLFIDGDHSYTGLRADFELYLPFLRSGGLVAPHDVAPRVNAGTGVPAFWRELRAVSETEEVVASVEPSYGIGFLRIGFDAPGA